ncbi:alpha/beta hydrolase [Acidisphaera sp. L21]|uniref:alpha/beta hydrolase n=1 Tax=Acidisphaera sp. L21 TaxID=1641851 RepID=UPI00131C21F7|nr:alpha/beta hydrolase [Acidisphaera sp. L21]
MNLPAGIRSRMVPGINGLDMHVLEAGDPAHPAVVLLHGFPELAYSWRKVMPALAAFGYHVIAPDQRGYGQTTGWSGEYDTDLRPFRLLNLARDVVSLVDAMGHKTVAGLFGHDFGSSVAAVCALVRPDVFRRVALMSAPFAGPPAIGHGPATPNPALGELARLDPPRKHYQWYYSGPDANPDMWHPPQGLHAFLRAYYHVKSADWAGNMPGPLRSGAATELARLPDYYVMPLAQGMAKTAAAHMPTADQIAACEWLPDAELAVYAAEYGRTGFGGGLHWYRCRTEGVNADLELFAGRTIDVPAVFIAGASDWGTYQSYGALQRMKSEACSRMTGWHLVPGAGHWVQQEQPEQVVDLLYRFLMTGE